MHGEHGTAAEVALPDEVFDGTYDSLHLDFALGCSGSRDVDCPIWDHVVQLFVCCEDPAGHACEACPTTVWAAPNRSFSDGMSSMTASNVHWQHDHSHLASCRASRLMESKEMFSSAKMLICAK